MANPITLAEVQQHLRLGTLDAAEQAEITTMITAATEMAESYCNRSWRSGTQTAFYDNLPTSEIDCLLVHDDVQSISTLHYYSSAHIQTPFIHYRLVNNGGRTKVYPAFGYQWPTDGSGLPASVELVYVSGDEASVPSSVKSAVLLMVGDLYENRENDVVGVGVAVNRLTSMTSKNLLHPYKTRIA